MVPGPPARSAVARYRWRADPLPRGGLGRRRPVVHAFPGRQPHPSPLRSQYPARGKPDRVRRQGSSRRPDVRRGIEKGRRREQDERLSGAPHHLPREISVKRVPCEKSVRNPQPGLMEQAARERAIRRRQREAEQMQSHRDARYNVRLDGGIDAPACDKRAREIRERYKRAPERPPGLVARSMEAESARTLEQRPEAGPTEAGEPALHVALTDEVLSMMGGAARTACSTICNRNLVQTTGFTLGHIPQ